MRVEVKRLQEGPVELEINETPETLEIVDPQFRFVEPVSGKIRFQLIDDKVLAEGDVSTAAETDCVRCLTSVKLPISARVSVMYENNPELLSPDHKFLGTDDGFISYFDGDIIDPTNEIREAIMVELPDFPVCDEDCKGLCPKCGANRNEDMCDCPQIVEKIDPWKDSLKNIKLNP